MGPPRNRADRLDGHLRRDDVRWPIGFVRLHIATGSENHINCDSSLPPFFFSLPLFSLPENPNPPILCALLK